MLTAEASAHAPLSCIASFQTCFTRSCRVGADEKEGGRGDTIRTCDIQLPKLALYQAELRPDLDRLASGKEDRGNMGKIPKGSKNKRKGEVEIRENGRLQGKPIESWPASPFLA